MNRLSGQNVGEHRQLAVKLATLLVSWQKRSLPNCLIERRYGEQILYFLIRSMNQYSGNESATSIEMLTKVKTILSDVFENNLWENVTLRLVLIERNLELGDGTDEKATAASAAIITFTELIKVMPSSINEILKLQNAFVTLVTKNDARITNALCQLIKQVFSQYPSHEALSPLSDALYAQVNDGLNQSENGTDPITEMRKIIQLIDAGKEMARMNDVISLPLIRAFHRLTKGTFSFKVAQFFVNNKKYIIYDQKNFQSAEFGKKLIKKFPRDLCYL